MPRIVAVHGIGQQFKGTHLLHAEWLPALRDGLQLAGAAFPDDSDLECAFYGDLFRRKGTKAFGDPPYTARDVTEGWEHHLLDLWWHEAARTDRHVVSPDALTKFRAPDSIQRALNALSSSRFFAGVGQRTLIGDLKQVRSYLHNEEIRRQIQSRVVAAVREDTCMLIGHSLGAVVAYEALCAHPEWPVHTFISLGSPLGIRNLIFDRLHPPPEYGIGVWPACLTRWTNVADQGDVVALVKVLRPQFGERIHDVLIDNGASAHSVIGYLTARKTGDSIATGLAS
jgi:hypothetical protein